MPNSYAKTTLRHYALLTVIRFKIKKLNKTVVADKHPQSVVVKMNDDEADITVWPWKKVKPKPKPIKKQNQVSSVLLTKKIALEPAPSTSSNQHTLLSDSTPNNLNEDENEAIDMTTEDPTDESAKNTGNLLKLLPQLWLNFTHTSLNMRGHSELLLRICTSRRISF